MARLAAYYQEDFQYPPIGHKQRKSNVFYEEPRNNLFDGYMLNGDRFRSLGTSEPTLSPLSHSCKPEKMTLKQKPAVYGSQVIENPHPAMQYFHNDNNSLYTYDRFARLPEDFYYNESIHPDDISVYDDRYILRHNNKLKNKAHKRFSYVEPQNDSRIPEVYVSQNYDRYRPQVHIESDLNISNNKYEPPSGNYYIDGPQANFYQPPVCYQNRATEGNWHQYPDEMSNRNLLSPPSPLDSGLSSQSITSSPSLETDSFPCHADFSPVSKTEPDRICSYSNQMYSDFRNKSVNLSRHDSGRSSGIYSAYGYPKESVRLKNGIHNNDMQSPQCREKLEYNGLQNSQVRYGKLGILGEPTNNDVSVNNTQNKKHIHSHKYGNGGLERLHETCYEDDDNVTAFKRTSSRMSQSHNHHSKYEKQYPLDVETVSKNSPDQCPISSELDDSDRNNGMVSSISPISSSTSKSSSLSSSNIELNCSKSRKTNRTTEKEIRELEDMYEKCNLSDVDLLDRAERRDLPTAHQTKSTPTLKRSKSDTIYETISPMLRNPFEIPRRAPPLRRSGLPDRVADDMALRKLHRSAKTSASTVNRNTITYMLCSSHFTPTVQSHKDILLLDYPDVEYDDLSYRKHYFGKKSKVADPQPPFGIPLRPPPPQKVFTDYLHAVPSNVPQPLCHPRGNPDVVRDDLAFRALRKDEPERLYYDISQLCRMRKK